MAKYSEADTAVVTAVHKLSESPVALRTCMHRLIGYPATNERTIAPSQKEGMLNQTKIGAVKSGRRAALRVVERGGDLGTLRPREPGA